MKEKKQDKSVRGEDKLPAGKKRFTKVKSNSMGTAFDMAGTILEDTTYEVKARYALLP